MKKTNKTKFSKEEEQLLDGLIEKYGISSEELFGQSGLFTQLKKRVIEKALSGELTHHLGYKKGAKPPGENNHRNGYSKKTIIGEDGDLEISIPRDRDGNFEPLLIAKGERRFKGFDSKIISMYARGMTVRDIRGFLLDQYGVDVGKDFITTVTDSVMEEVLEWQNRPLESTYAVVFFDALRVKIRDEGVVKNKAVYLALAVTLEGKREVLGIWIERSEGAKFWLNVMNELHNRGVEDILIAVVDGLKGFPEAITTVFEKTQIQTCIVHLIRNSLRFCGWKERKEITNQLKNIYKAENAEIAFHRLKEFEQSPINVKYPMIAESWHRHWEEVIPFFDYPKEIRSLIYTTNAIESLHMQLRKVTKNRGHFPNDEAAIKLLYLALKNIDKKWQNTSTPIWSRAIPQFAIKFKERFTK